MKSKKALRIRESLIREYIRELLIEKAMTFADIERAIKSAAEEQPWNLQLRRVSKSHQTRMGPVGEESKEKIKNMSEEDLKQLLRNAGFETVAVRHASDRDNKSSDTFSEFEVHPIGQPEYTKMVTFSRSGGVPRHVLNEKGFVNGINSVASKDYPITVKIGDSYELTGVTEAKSVGTKKIDGQVSKADANVVNCGRDDCDPVNVSIKLPSADYWLSGDKALRNVFEKKVKSLMKRVYPAIRIEDVNGMLVMMDGDKQLKKIWWEIDPAIQKEAVFGRGKNRAEVVAEGIFLKDGIWDERTRTLSWPNAKVYKTLEDLPENDRPVGVLRKAEKKRRGSWTKDYPGTRPVVARKGFAISGESRPIP